MSAELSRHPSTLHYKQYGITVTSRYFANETARYDVSGLSHLARSQGSAHPGVRVGLFTAAAELLIIVPMLALTRSPIGVAIALPALFIPCLASYICARRWPAQISLLAQYRGRLVTLITTTSEHQFGQVARALMRVLEAAQASDRDQITRGPIPRQM